MKGRTLLLQGYLPYRELLHTCFTDASDTSEWRHRLAERDQALEAFEIAEAKYIKSFRLVPTSSNGQKLDYVQGTPDTPKYPFAPKGELFLAVTSS